jgi:hypothetical protein
MKPIAAVVVVFLSACAPASAAKTRTCGGVPGTQTGVIHAGAGTSCAFARKAVRVWLAGRDNGTPAAAPFYVNGKRLRCTQPKSGATVLRCRGARRYVSVTGERQ